MREAAEEVPSAALRFPSGGPAGRPTSPCRRRLNAHSGAIEGNNCLARPLLPPRLSEPASGHQGIPRHLGAEASRGIRVAAIPLWPPVADLLTFLSSGSPPRHWRTVTRQRRNFLWKRPRSMELMSAPLRLGPEARLGHFPYSKGPGAEPRRVSDSHFPFLSGLRADFHFSFIFGLLYVGASAGSLPSGQWHWPVCLDYRLGDHSRPLPHVARTPSAAYACPIVESRVWAPECISF